jgi:hypothetical protein
MNWRKLGSGNKDMNTPFTNKRLVAILGTFVLLLVLWLLVPLQREQVVLAPHEEGARHLFGGGKAVAQEFIPPRGLAHIVIPMGSLTLPSGPLLLHLRTELLGTDIRTSTVFALDDNEQEVRFSFAPLIAPPKKVFWILEAPHTASQHVWVYREQDAHAFPGGRAFAGHRPTKGNFGFTLHYYEPMYQHVLRTLRAANSWEQLSFVVGFVGALTVVSAASFVLPLLKRFKKGIVLVVALVGVGAHLFFITHFPVINDEGAYIQDVLQAEPHFLPFRDFLTKGPLYLFLLKLWQLLIPHTIIFWRFLSAISWGVTTYLFSRLLQTLQFPVAAQLLAVLFMALLPAALSLTTPLLLQNTSGLFVIGALYLLVLGIRRQHDRFIVGAALLMAAAYFIRVSSIVPMFIAGLFIIFLARQRILRMLFLYGGTLAITMLAVFVLSAMIMGVSKTAVLFNLEAFFISQQRAEVLPEEAELPIRLFLANSQLLWRTAPLLLSGLLLWPILSLRRWEPFSVVALILVLVPLIYLTLGHLVDMEYLLPDKFPLVRAVLLGLVVFLPLGWLCIQVVLPTFPAVASSLPRVLLLCILWLVGLVVAYGQWGRFRHSYIVEFLPPLIVVASWSFITLAERWRAVSPRFLRSVGSVLVLTLGGASIMQGMVLAYNYPHTGNIDQGELAAVVSLVQQYVPAREPLFTAQPVVTAFAKRPIIFGYAHPGWYREERLGIVSSSLRKLFFMEPQQLTEYLRTQARFVLNDRRTEEVYFDGYPERKQILEESFEELGRVENTLTGTPFVLYQRKD